MYLKNTVFKYLENNYYVIMRIFKLYYTNLLEIIPKIFEVFQVFYITKEDNFFVIYLRYSPISKFNFLNLLFSLDINLPYYIYTIDTKTRINIESIFHVTPKNKTRLNKRINYNR